MTATVTETTKERLERQREKLLNRKAELGDALEAAPGAVAIAREKWIRSESTSDEKKLKQARLLAELTATELEETNASLGVVDGLLAVEVAKEAEARKAEVHAEAARLSEAQREALSAFGKWFAAGYPLWENYAESVRAADTLWRGNPGVFGDVPPHVIQGRFPIRFGSLLELAVASLHRDWSSGGDRNELNEFVPASLPPDPPLEIGGTLDRF